MARYAISNEGATSMKALAKQLYTEANAILEASSTLENKVASISQGLGIYEPEILSLIQQSRNILKANREDILNLAQRILQKAAEVEELVTLSGSSNSSFGDEQSIRNSNSVNNSMQLTSENSKEYATMVNALENAGVTYRPIELSPQGRSSEQIIMRLSGGDLTEGSCSSLALAYAGNKAGYDVLDFRDGESRDFFSSRDTIQKISDLPNVQSIVLRGTNDIECTHQLLSGIKKEKEYYLATGRHAAIIRQINGQYEYLELQHPSNGNGWHVLDDYILTNRFGCSNSRTFATSSFLIDVESMSANQEFLNILGFINTAGSEQRKGVSGNVR